MDCRKNERRKIMKLPENIEKEMEEYEVGWDNGRFDIITHEDDILSIYIPILNLGQEEKIQKVWNMVKLNAKRKEV